jgi:hypothetical protein
MGAANPSPRPSRGTLRNVENRALGDPQDRARLDKISQAIDYLGTGFPLSARPPATTP